MLPSTWAASTVLLIWKNYGWNYQLLLADLHKGIISMQATTRWTYMYMYVPRPPTVPLDSINSPNQLNSGYEDIKLSEAGTMGDEGMVGAKVLLLICKSINLYTCTYKAKHNKTNQFDLHWRFCIVEKTLLEFHKQARLTIVTEVFCTLEYGSYMHFPVYGSYTKYVGTVCIKCDRIWE